jgi:aminopeptidase YwaD
LQLNYFKGMRIILYCLLLCQSAAVFAQRDKEIKANLVKHIYFLADDKLEGRRTGTDGAEKALTYINSEFSKIGLQCMNESCTQAFTINDGLVPAKQSICLINGDDLKMDVQWRPLPFSGNNEANFIGLPDNTGKVTFVNVDNINFKANPHAEVEDVLRDTAEKLQNQNIKAVIFYQGNSEAEKFSFNAKSKLKQLNIPVVFVAHKAAQNYIINNTNTIELKIQVEWQNKNRNTSNAIGYINNKANSTVILGAHYDHLGYGEDNNSMYRGKEKLIHNGADDNASGTAALIELARILKKNGSKKFNYVFIAFSGEELGLFGSKFYVENPLWPLTNVNYMINMDMVGRLNDSTQTLTVGGYGTSPTWGNIITKNMAGLNIKIDSSGTGPSDHASFYRKDIPVLFFFTGLHTDYHKPEDDADKINFDGEVKIIRLIAEVIKATAKYDKLSFTKTREQSMGSSTRFSVSLGIMPDYTFSGTGVKADGVSDNKPAKAAGIQAGDIITKIGDYTITDMDNYMKTLGKFKKGDAVEIEFLRKGKTEKVNIVF